LDKTDARIAAVYASRSGREVAHFEQLMAENDGLGRWLSPEEAVEAGLVDRIVDREQRRKSLGQRIKAAVAGVFNATREEQKQQSPKIARSTLRPTTPNDAEMRVERMRKAQQGVDKTRLSEIEDPAVCDVRQSFNEMAYTRDAENFKIH
jgi:enoyl-CoA hydratase/carnithine racemase